MTFVPLLTVDRAMDVLSCFTANSREWGITELATEIGLTKSQTHRLVATLASRGFLSADPVSRRYELGPRVVALGRIAEQNDFSLAILTDLANASGASALFSRADGAFYRCMAAANSSGILGTTIVGMQIPGYGGGASGDAIYAHLPESQARIMLGDNLVKSDGTPGETWEELSERYREIREAGVAISFGEWDKRVGAIAAPVLVETTVIGSVSVIAPVQEIAERVKSISIAVMESASNLSQLYRGVKESSHVED